MARARRTAYGAPSSVRADASTIDSPVTIMRASSPWLASRPPPCGFRVSSHSTFPSRFHRSEAVGRTATPQSDHSRRLFGQPAVQIVHDGQRALARLHPVLERVQASRSCGTAPAAGSAPFSASCTRDSRVSADVRS